MAFEPGKKIDLEKYRSISISGSSMPTRKGVIQSLRQHEKDQSADMAAYKRLRREGLQPPRIDGSAEVEKRAEHKHQVEGRPDPKVVERVLRAAE